MVSCISQRHDLCEKSLKAFQTCYKNRLTATSKTREVNYYIVTKMIIITSDIISSQYLSQTSFSLGTKDHFYISIKN